MEPPVLLIFDIDETLIRTGIYHSADEVKKGLFDPECLTKFLVDPAYQVAIASFNTDVYQSCPPFGGRRLGRMILDLQHPTFNSKVVVEDDFIQAWYDITLHTQKIGKNTHIDLILQAYNKKYGMFPKIVIFYDDQLENCYLASKKGIVASLVTEGLTNRALYTSPNIGNRVRYITVSPTAQLMACSVGNLARFTSLEQLVPFVTENGQTEMRECLLYLPKNENNAKAIVTEFFGKLAMCGITANMISWND